MQLFDVHAHFFPDKIAASTVEKIGAASNLEPAYDGTRAGLLKAMQTAHINLALNLPIATNPEKVRSINEWNAQNSVWPILSLGCVHPDTPDPEAALHEVKRLGLPGIKLHPEYQSFTLDDARMIPIWRTCEELGLVIMMHAGADIAFQSPFKTEPIGFADLLQQYPGLKMILAHLGSWRMWDEVDAHLAGADVYMDLSFTLGFLPDEQVLDICRKHDTSRILFGTDAPWRNPSSYVQRFLQMDWSEAEKQAIAWDNGIRLFGLEEVVRTAETDAARS